jgi:hypothetical protein
VCRRAELATSNSPLSTVEKHVHHMLGNVARPESSDDHRRVFAGLTFLDAG